MHPEVLGKVLEFLGTKATPAMFPFTELSPQAVDTKPTLGLPPLLHHGSSALQTAPKFRALMKAQPINVKLSKSTSLLSDKALLFSECSQEPGTINQRESKAGCDPKSLE